MQFTYISFLSIIATGAALTCKMCDNYISCANEMSEQCPPHTQCYTIKRHGTVTHKGCAMSCAALPYAVSDAHCTTCNHRDNCNGVPEFIPKFLTCSSFDERR
ncbi:hypothetical protein Y032_0023g689 [Ancylostoma ceylanicum]|uniref:Uncharacterized protein n=1 Tax=Ancylostoma ceylanicum TaxID=53326 RepID=A0A016UXJ8_9BILA|nr:hypothetical protein Y032_0023g689 [Ancylostoma ceylanicum]